MCMDELVLKYLSSLYWADPHNNHICEHITDTKVYGEDLQEDIVDMFQVSEVVATACIEIWIYDEAPTFDTNKYWEEPKLVGQDLVAVQPLEMPRGLLMYMDFQYEAQTATIQAMGVPAERLGQDHQVQIQDDNENLRNEMQRYRWLQRDVGVVMENPASYINFTGITIP